VIEQLPCLTFIKTTITAHCGYRNNVEKVSNYKAKASEHQENYDSTVLIITKIEARDQKNTTNPDTVITEFDEKSIDSRHKMLRLRTAGRLLLLGLLRVGS
jgi:secreted Zn-dependent insulinase-like peptidase